MRNIKLLVLLFTLAITLNAFQKAFSQPVKESDKQEISFIYINGANNNTPKMKKWFYDGIGKFHPVIRKEILASKFMQKYFLEDDKYTIAYLPQIFFWGDKSALEIKSLREDLMYTKSSSPKLAQLVRTVFTNCMHDAIWVQKDHNMHDLVEDLHKMVMDNYNKNRPVVLFGYSAGTFITYEYLFNKLPNIDTQDLFTQIEAEPEILDFIAENRSQDTCIDALINSKLTVFTNLGHLVVSQNTNNFKQNYLNLDQYTQKYCMPQGAVKGIVNYASPLPLFYSDITNPNYVVTYYVRLLYKYIVENDMFWLTVNYADDPLGYPTTRNLTPKEYEKTLDILLKDKRYGFIFDKSNVKSPKTFIGAHTSYWATSQKFAKAITDGYEEGYIYFNFFEKVVEKNKMNKESL